MSTTHEIEISSDVPSLFGASVFRGKSFLLQCRRAVLDSLKRTASRSKRSEKLIDAPVIAESRSQLWSEIDKNERELVAGKIQNLRVAVAELNGVELERGEVFSFWKNVGRTTRRRGFVEGRELREGCIIPKVGGGLCQLSNALYDAALKANFDIVERHAHTRVIAGSLAEQDRDATVFWNYVDLRFRSSRAFRIEAELSQDHLNVRFRTPAKTDKQLHALTRTKNADHILNSCASCGMDDCFRSMKPVEKPFGKTAFLVDEFTPEFDGYVRSAMESNDELYIPIDGKRFRKGNYAWTTDGFSRVTQDPVLTAIRSYRSRRLAAQGAARQRNLLEMSRRLAAGYARRLKYDALHLVIQQEMLPFLWTSGALGGRTFDILAGSLPMAEIQRRLDVAYQAHPQSRTLGDFRADDALIKAESEAFAAARKIITSHSAVAALFPEKADLVEWAIPEIKAPKQEREGKPVIVFPASTVGRKGCYELRDAIRSLDVKLLTMGPYIEDADFWSGFDVEKAGDDWVERASSVVLPAFVEHRPRRLLRAIAAGVPVIASEACGLGNLPEVINVADGDAKELQRNIEDVIRAQKNL